MVLLPVMTLLLWFVLFAYVATVGLPIAAAYYLYVADWWLAAGCAAAWLPAYLLVRWVWRREHSDDTRDNGILV